MTGSILAHAVEAEHRSPAVGSDGRTHEPNCLNCGATLVGSYCHNCGQQAHAHRTLLAIFHDILHGVFHFEGKVWRTLPMLVWKPGDLTRRYIHGERARFVSPLALFLLCVFAMFATFSSIGGPMPLRFSPGSDGAKSATAEMARERDALSAELLALKKRRLSAVAAGTNVAALDRGLAEKQSEADSLAVAAESMTKGVDIEVAAKLVDIETGDKALDESFKQSFKNPKLLLYKLQSSAYKFAWALIPISLPLMWIIFAWRPQYKFYDHAVFVSYSLSFIMVLLVIMSLVTATGISAGWGLLLIPLHMFRQLRQAYTLTTLSALWRTVYLSAVAPMILALFGGALLAMGLLG